MAALYIIGLIFSGYALCTFLIVITHALGYAVTYLVLTKPERIDVSLGVWEHPKNALRIKAGRLRFNITYKAFLKCIGYCETSKTEFNYKTNKIILFVGNIIPLLIAILTLSIAFGYDLHGGIKLFTIAYFLYTLFIACINFTGTPIINSDSYIIINAVRRNNNYLSYYQGCDFFMKQDYKNAAKHLEIFNSLYPDNIDVIRSLLTCYTALRDTENTLRIYHQFKDQPDLSEQDFITLGYINSITRNSEVAIDYYIKALSSPDTYRNAMLNLAFEMIISGQYALADEKLSTLINNMPNEPNAYGYLGYSKIMQNELEEGKALIDKCFKKGGDDNAYMYKALGIYYMKIDDRNKAWAYFDKAKQLDSWVNVDEYTSTQLSD